MTFSIGHLFQENFADADISQIFNGKTKYWVYTREQYDSKINNKITLQFLIISLGIFAVLTGVRDLKELWED